MIDTSLREALISRRFDGEFILPSYDDFCLSNVPATIQSFFGLRTGHQLYRKATSQRM